MQTVGIMCIKPDHKFMQPSPAALVSLHTDSIPLFTEFNVSYTEKRNCIRKVDQELRKRFYHMHVQISQIQV